MRYCRVLYNHIMPLPFDFVTVCCILCISLTSSSAAATGLAAITTLLPRWSTATLSAARSDLSATSLPNQLMAFFAGGDQTPGFPACQQNFIPQTPAIVCMVAPSQRCLAGGPSNTVDIFDAASGKWSKTSLSVPRKFLCATSLIAHGLAFFAGGLKDPGGMLLPSASRLEHFQPPSDMQLVRHLTILLQDTPNPLIFSMASQELGPLLSSVLRALT